MDYGYGHGAQWGGYHGDELASHFYGYPELGEFRGLGGFLKKFKRGGGKKMPWSKIAPKIQDIQGRITGGLKSIADASGNK